MKNVAVLTEDGAFTLFFRPRHSLTELIIVVATYLTDNNDNNNNNNNFLKN